MIFASNNKNKINQLKEFLQDNNVVGLKEFGLDIDVIEDGETFEANAVKKAKEIYEVSGQPTLADDSGLCIDIFNGWPGVYTHRFLGENSTEQERNAHILTKMKDIPLKKRNCSVVCVIAYCDKQGKITTFKGEFKSKISLEERGENFFGFDSIVYKDKKHKETIADLSNEEKLKINARSLALEKFKKFYKKLKANK